MAVFEVQIAHNDSIAPLLEFCTKVFSEIPESTANSFDFDKVKFTVKREEKAERWQLIRNQLF